MHQRLKSIVAVWFVVQIVLPFMAPLSSCDLADLLGTRQQQKRPTSGAATPVSDADSDGNSFVSPLAVSMLRASSSLAAVQGGATSRTFVSAFDLSPSPQVQQTVLRV